MLVGGEAGEEVRGGGTVLPPPDYAARLRARLVEITSTI